MKQINLFAKQPQLNEYLMSINQGSGAALLTGRKPHEFRRKFDKYDGQIKVYLYSTAPHKKIIGHVIFNAPIHAHPDELVKLLETNQHDTEARLLAYFKGLEKAFALPVAEAVTYKKPLSLDALKSKVPGFQPPMSYLCISHPKQARLKAALNEHERSD